MAEESKRKPVTRMCGHTAYPPQKSGPPFPPAIVSRDVV